MSKAVSIVMVIAAAAVLQAGPPSALGAESNAPVAKPAARPDVKPAVKPAVKPIKVVILVGGHGYDKGPFPQAWGGHADIQCEIWKGKPYTVFDDLDKFTYDVILMYNLSSGITDKQKANFLTLLKRGVGVVVWHHALANCQNWPEFEKIAGCKFWMRPGKKDGKPVGNSGTGHAKYKMHIADAAHPITKGMADFEIQDESYNKQTFVKGIRVLVTTDHPKSDKPIAWVVKYSGSRVFGYQSGHDVKAWANPNFRRLLGNGIRWVARRLGPPDEKTPANAPAKAPAKAPAPSPVSSTT